MQVLGFDFVRCYLRYEFQQFFICVISTSDFCDLLIPVQMNAPF